MDSIVLSTVRAIAFERRNAPWLAVDTYFIRMGDVASAGPVFVGGRILRWPLRAFAIVNPALVVLCSLLARGIVLRNRVLTKRVGNRDMGVPSRATERRSTGG